MLTKTDLPTNLCDSSDSSDSSDGSDSSDSSDSCDGSNGNDSSDSSDSKNYGKTQTQIVTNLNTQNVTKFYDSNCDKT